MMDSSSERSTGAATPDDREDTRVGVAQRSIALHVDYPAAARTVERLREAGFPIERSVVLGSALRAVSRAQGRLSTADVTGRGALSGLLVGAAIGWLLCLFGLTDDALSAWWLVAIAAVLGPVLGAVVALLGYVVTWGRRSFAPDGAVRVGRYEVAVDADLADQAMRMLHSTASGDGRAPGATQQRAEAEPSER